MTSRLLFLCLCAVFYFVLVFVFVIGSGLRIVFKQVHFPSEVSFPLTWAFWGIDSERKCIRKLWLRNIYYSIVLLERKTRPSILCVTQKRAFMPLYIVLGQQRACMPVYIGKSGDLVGWHRCLTHWLTHSQTTEYRATQLLSSIQFKLSHAIVAFFSINIIDAVLIDVQNPNSSPAKSISNNPLLKMCTEPYWHLEWMLFLAEGFSEKRRCAKPIIELGPLSTKSRKKYTNCKVNIEYIVTLRWTNHWASESHKNKIAQIWSKVSHPVCSELFCFNFILS